MVRYRSLLLGLAIAAALAFGATWRIAATAPGVRPTGDALAVPLDDAAIYFQYAREAVHGQWLRYYPGEPLSTGVTSDLYFLLATLGAGLGMGAPIWAWLLGLGSLLLGLVSADRMARRLFPDCPPWWAGALLLSQGAWVAAHFNALETGLLLGLTWAALDAVSDPEAGARVWLALGALALTRPEGQVLALVLGGAWALEDGRPQRLAVVALLAAFPSLLLMALSGSAVPDSVRPKSVTLDSQEPLLVHAATASRYAVAVLKGAWMGFWGGADAVGVAGDAASGNPIGQQFPPLALLCSLAGWAHLALQGGPRRRLALSALAAAAALLALLAWNLPVGWHDHRYLNCVTPLLLAGMLAFTQALAREDSPVARAALYAFAGLWLAFGLATWPWQLWRCYDGAVHYAEANTNAALALKALPPGPVAVVDSGLLAYYSGREVVDLPGITDHAQALAYAQGPGAMFETLLRRARPPVYGAFHNDRPDFDLKPWIASGVLRRVGPLAQDMGLYRWDYSGVGAAQLPIAPPPGAVELATLPVADPTGDELWGFRPQDPRGTTVLARMALRPGGAGVPEGGRRLAGFELARGVPPEARFLLMRAVFPAAGRLLLSQGGPTKALDVLPSPAGTYSEVDLPLDPAEAARPLSVMYLRPDRDVPAGFGLYRLWCYASPPPRAEP